MKKIGILIIFILLVLTGCIINTSNSNTKKAPDLIVSNIELVEDCKIRITIKNIGTGGVYYPGHKAIVHMLRNGDRWHGIRLIAIDPIKVLKMPGGSVSYIWFPDNPRLKLWPGKHKITLIVDTDNIIKESNERNNRKTFRLECRELKEALEENVDLNVQDEVKEAIRKKAFSLENLKTNKSVYSIGEPIYIEYEFVNNSDKKVNIPLNKDYSKPMYIIGSKQAWIEPLDKGVHFDNFGGVGGVKKQGSRYPAGGSIIQINKDHLSAKEILPFKFTFSRPLNAGHYRYYLQLLNHEDRSLINEKIIEFTVKK